MAALFISVGNAILASLIAIGGGLTMVGALSAAQPLLSRSLARAAGPKLDCGT